jgi:hypothetical protein
MDELVYHATSSVGHVTHHGAFKQHYVGATCKSKGGDGFNMG